MRQRNLRRDRPPMRATGLVIHSIEAVEKRPRFLWRQDLVSSHRGVASHAGEDIVDRLVESAPAFDLTELLGEVG